MKTNKDLLPSFSQFLKENYSINESRLTDAQKKELHADALGQTLTNFNFDKFLEFLNLYLVPKKFTKIYDRNFQYMSSKIYNENYFTTNDVGINKLSIFIPNPSVVRDSLGIDLNANTYKFVLLKGELNKLKISNIDEIYNKPNDTVFGLTLDELFETKF